MFIIRLCAGHTTRAKKFSSSRQQTSGGGEGKALRRRDSSWVSLLLLPLVFLNVSRNLLSVILNLISLFQELECILSQFPDFSPVVDMGSISIMGG